VRKPKKRIVLESVPVSGYAAEGKAIARQDGKVIFVQGAVPGDRADLLLTKNKKDFAEALAIRITEPSSDRVVPFCRHFGVCGGCKWQMLPYHKQLEYKQQEVFDNLTRIGKTGTVNILPIIGSEHQTAYRNKLEFTFSNKKFLTEEDQREGVDENTGALGYHVARVFHKAIEISECHLMSDVNDKVRNELRNIAREKNFSYYDIKQHAGWLRNIILRLTRSGELMVNVVLNHEEEENRKWLLDELLKHVPEISTLLYTINPKWNDSIYDLQPQVYFGKGYVTERLHTGEGEKYFDFIVGPKSFFQTNTQQAENLYRVTAEFAGLTGKETVYDLYCGTGSIGIFLSDKAARIIGVETIEEAVRDAKKNAELNNISHAEFFAGDVIKVCDDEFFKTHGRPDVIITDPPRAGMHEKLVRKLLEIEAPRIVYVSCNTATQARDILLLSEKYEVEKVRPVDMFPHTHHIESVAALRLKS
jgi:23S rRNA (uracil1939-C5)-methyltransferase